MDQALNRLLLREDIVSLLAAYNAALDNQRYDEWPDLFTETCLYQVISLENHMANWPLGIMRCESRGMLKDRIQAVRELITYGGRRHRHFVDGTQIVEEDSGEIVLESNVLVLQTEIDKEPRVLLSGRYLDRLRRVDDRLRFAQRICIYDNNLIFNSVPIPL